MTEKFQNLEKREAFSKLKKALDKMGSLQSNIDYLQLTIASSQKIKSWAQRKLPDVDGEDGEIVDGEIVGEITSGETVSFRTGIPEKGGLFCPQVFGPIYDWQCTCGRYNGLKPGQNHLYCPVCGIEIAETRIRRYRMGYISLTMPVVHPWYFKGTPNYLLLILSAFVEPVKKTEIRDGIEHEVSIGVTYPHIDSVIYQRDGTKQIDRFNPLKEYQNLIEVKLKEGETWSPFHRFVLWESPESKPYDYRQGAEIIENALNSYSTDSVLFELSKQMSDSIEEGKETPTKIKKLAKQIRLFESMKATGTHFRDIILDSIPVLPPTLRPLMELEGSVLVSADLNILYRLLLTRSFRYKRYAPEDIGLGFFNIQEKKLLQFGVESIIDNSRLPQSRTQFLNNQPLRGLTENLETKFGRFRYNLLGKRVDYSARSVIVVEPGLRLNQFGLPYEIAVELFEPFLIDEILKMKMDKMDSSPFGAKAARGHIRRNRPFIWKLLEKLCKKYSFLLNRAPTLHRFGIQSFDPVLILEKAIQLHPLVCTGFNADFDGDQMAIHLPLFSYSQAEAKSLMRPWTNILSPANGELILKPSQDMVIGTYYLTLLFPSLSKAEEKIFNNSKDALAAYSQKQISLHEAIYVRYSTDDFEIQWKDKKHTLCKKRTFSYERSEEESKDLDPFELFGSIEFEILHSKTSGEKIYLFTSIGLFVGNAWMKGKFELRAFYLETTAGRLIFTTSLENLRKKK
jgi:DNA-directed RNA polymerase subunit beta'